MKTTAVVCVFAALLAIVSSTSFARQKLEIQKIQNNTRTKANNLVKKYTKIVDKLENQLYKQFKDYAVEVKNITNEFKNNTKKAKALRVDINDCFDSSEVARPVIECMKFYHKKLSLYRKDFKEYSGKVENELTGLKDKLDECQENKNSTNNIIELSTKVVCFEKVYFLYVSNPAMRLKEMENAFKSIARGLQKIKSEKIPKCMQNVNKDVKYISAEDKGKQINSCIVEKIFDRATDTERQMQDKIDENEKALQELQEKIDEENKALEELKTKIANLSDDSSSTEKTKKELKRLEESKAKIESNLKDLKRKKELKEVVKKNLATKLDKLKKNTEDLKKEIENA